MHFEHSLVGKSSPPQTFEVTLEAVKRFMEATVPRGACTSQMG